MNQVVADNSDGTENPYDGGATYLSPFTSSDRRWFTRRQTWISGAFCVLGWTAISIGGAWAFSLSLGNISLESGRIQLIAHSVSNQNTLMPEVHSHIVWLSMWPTLLFLLAAFAVSYAFVFGVVGLFSRPASTLMSDEYGLAEASC